jgi:hypothetical protein
MRCGRSPCFGSEEQKKTREEKKTLFLSNTVVGTAGVLTSSSPGLTPKSRGLLAPMHDVIFEVGTFFRRFLATDSGQYPHLKRELC